jgi:hypothetical protein
MIRKRIITTVGLCLASLAIPIAAQAHGPTPWLYNYNDYAYANALCLFTGSPGANGPVVKSHYADGHEHSLSFPTCR